MPKFRKKPVVIEAVQLTENSVIDVYRFIHGEKSVNLSGRMAEDGWDNYVASVKKEGLKLKTPESGGGTQIANIGDWIVKGNSKELGEHFWPVKDDYFTENYEPVN